MPSAEFSGLVGWEAFRLFGMDEACLGLEREEDGFLVLPSSAREDVGSLRFLPVVIVGSVLCSWWFVVGCVLLR